MDGENKKDKPKPDRKKYMIAQYVGNLIGCLIVTPMLVMLVFKVFGDGSGDLITVRAFVLVFISCFMLIQAHTAIVNTRRDFLRGRWVLVDGEESIGADSIINPWRRVGLLVLIAGVVTAALTCLAVPLLGSGPFGRLTIDLITFVPLFIVSTILIGVILPHDQVSFVAALSRPKPERPEPLFRYFFFEHIGPWMLLQGLINFGIGLKQFRHEVLKVESIDAGGVSATLVGGDFGIVFGIIFFFMWVASEGQVRSDARLGRVSERAFSRSRFGEMNAALVVVLAILLSAVIMAVVGGAMVAVFYVAGIDAVSVTGACVLKTVAAVAGCVFGCGAGIWWGKRREAALKL